MKRRQLIRFGVTTAVLCAFSAPWAIGQNPALRSADGAPGPLIIPHASWDCGIPAGIPAPERGKLLLEFQMKLEKVLNVGKTPYGERQVAVVQEGTVSGERLTGTVTIGALDFELKLSNGVIEVEQIFVLRASDGKYIYESTR